MWDPFFQDFKTFPGLVPQTFLALSVRVTVPNQEGCKGFLGHIGLYGDMRGVVCVFRVQIDKELEPQVSKNTFRIEYFGACSPLTLNPKPYTLNPKP